MFIFSVILQRKSISRQYIDICGKCTFIAVSNLHKKNSSNRSTSLIGKNQDCAEEIRKSPRERFCDLTSFFFFEILTKNSVWKSAFSTYVYITSRNWFSLKNNGKNEQLLLKTFFSKSIFRDFLLVKLGSFTTRALLKNRLTKKCLY